jgi:hypothetical protein
MKHQRPAPAERQRDRQTDIWTRLTVRRMDGQAGRQAARQTEGQADRPAPGRSSCPASACTPRADRLESLRRRRRRPSNSARSRPCARTRCRNTIKHKALALAHQHKPPHARDQCLMSSHRPRSPRPGLREQPLPHMGTTLPSTVLSALLPRGDRGPTYGNVRSSHCWRHSRSANPIVHLK